MGTRRKLILFTGLYFAQGVPWGFFTIAILLRLSSLGMGSADIAQVLSAAWLPWTFKPLLGPFVDRLKRRRPLILVAETGMALSILGLATVNPMAHVGLLSGLLLIHNAFAAAQDVGTDALALDLLSEDERGRANGYMSAGKYLGVLAGGQGLLFLARALGWFPAHLAAMALLVLPGILLFTFHEQPRMPGPIVAVGKQLLTLVKSRLVLVSLIFALILDSADTLLMPMLMPFYTRTLGYSEQAVATLSTVGGAMGALGSILGGMLSDRRGHRATLVCSCVASAALTMVFASLQVWWTNYAFILGLAIAGGIVGGVIYSSSLALFMDLTSKEFPATHFQLYMSLWNARGVWAPRVGGPLSERLAPATMFRISALVEVIPLVLLFWLRRPRSKNEAATDPR